jgi:autotransporter-associated beta strand protein
MLFQRFVLAIIVAQTSVVGVGGAALAQERGTIDNLPVEAKEAFFGMAPLGRIPTGTPIPTFWQGLLNQTNGIINGTIDFPYLLPLRSTTPSDPSMQTYAILDAPYTRPNLYQLADGYGTRLGAAYQRVATWSNPTEPYSDRKQAWTQVSKNVTDLIWFTGSRLRDTNLIVRGILGSGITRVPPFPDSNPRYDFKDDLAPYGVQRAIMAKAYGLPVDGTVNVVFTTSTPDGRVFRVGAKGDLAQSVLISDLRMIGDGGDPKAPPVLFQTGGTNSRPFEVFSVNPTLGSIPTFYARNYNTDGECTTTTCTNYNSNWAYMVEPPEDPDNTNRDNRETTYGNYGIDGQVRSASYASGHAIYGWYGGLILGMLLPEAFQKMNTRGAENALGRVIGGWHWPTDIIASRTLTYYGVAQMMAGEEGYYGDAVRPIPAGMPTTGAASQGPVVVAPAGQPGSFISLLNAARADMAQSLTTACETSITACAQDDTSRFADKETNRRFYEATLTLGLPRVWSEAELTGYVLDFNNFVPAPAYLAWNTQTSPGKEKSSARNAGYLLYTRFPYLSQEQRNEVLTTTVVPDAEGRGTFLDNGSAFGAYSRINLFKASDGYGSFRSTVDVTMNAADGGFSAADTWSNNIDGPGGLIKRGTGILTLAGTNTFTGPITLNGGGLNVTGSVATSLGVVANAGVLGGTGNLPSTTINAGATHAPGNSIGTQTVNGNYALNGGTLAIELQGPQNDRINVSGNVNPFTGTAQLISFGGGTPWPSFNYTIVSAPNSAPFAFPNSLTLDDTQVPSALLRFGARLVQEADGNPQTFDVQWQPLNAIGATTAAMQSLRNTSSNALATAGILDRSIQQLQVQSNSNANSGGEALGTSGFTQNQATAAGQSPAFIQAVSNLIALPSGSALTTAVNAISPQPYSSFLSVGLDTLRLQRSQLLGQAGQCQQSGWVIKTSSESSASSATGSGKKSRRTPLCVFALAGNATANVNGDQTLSSYDSSIFSSGLGLEATISREWTVGLAYGYGTSNANNFSLASASVTADVNSISIYSVYRPDQRWSFSGLLGYSNFSISGNRSIPGLDQSLAGSTSSNGVTAALEASYLVPISNPKAATQVLAKPLLGLAWGGYQQRGFAETGGGFSQQVNGRTANSLLGTVGVELMTSPLPLNTSRTATITPRLAVAYQVDALANTSRNKTLESSFVGAPAAGALTTEGQNLGVNNLNLSAGFSVNVASNLELFASASYLVISNANQFSYGGGLRVKF